MPLTCRWSDLGAWDAILKETGPDGNGNATHGPVTLLDTTGSYVRAEEPGMQVVGLGLSDMIVVAKREAPLIVAHADGIAYCASDVAWITPLADGMNLVCKEFAAARVDRPLDFGQQCSPARHDLGPVAEDQVDILHLQAF